MQDITLDCDRESDLDEEAMKIDEVYENMKNVQALQKGNLDNVGTVSEEEKINLDPKIIEKNDM